MLRCIAIDDELLAVSVIEAFCRRYGNIDLSTFTDPEKGLRAVKNTEPDILFLDIEMGGVSGMDIAASIPESVCLVFTTAYTEFAVKGFELNAVDYLHKPFSYQRFEKAVKKADELIRMRSKAGNIPCENQMIATVKSDYRSVPVPVSDIQYIESFDNYINIIVSDRPVISTRISLRDFLDELPHESFIRIHRSYAVAKEKIASYSRREVVLFYKSTRLPVGRAYADAFISYMKKD